MRSVFVYLTIDSCKVNYHLETKNTTVFKNLMCSKIFSKPEPDI